MKTYQGSCHCGAVKFNCSTEAKIIHRCNCSICAKKGFLHLIVAKENFNLLTPKENITDYQFGTKTAHHYFCRNCGICSYYIPRSHPDGFSVNARCLDVELSEFEIKDFDGQNWEASVSSIKSS